MRSSSSRATLICSTVSLACASVNSAVAARSTPPALTRSLAPYLKIRSPSTRRYNTVMKIIFLGTAFTIIYYMRRHKVVAQTYDKDQDTFRVLFLIVPCFLLALVINHELSVTEVLWTFSIYLEAVAILPQLVLLQRTKNVDNLTGNYIFMLGSYRALYLVNWIYRYFTELGYRQWIVWVSGTVQTCIYLDFFYYYVQAWRNNERMKLPG